MASWRDSVLGAATWDDLVENANLSRLLDRGGVRTEWRCALRAKGAILPDTLRTAAVITIYTNECFPSFLGTRLAGL